MSTTEVLKELQGKTQDQIKAAAEIYVEKYKLSMSFVQRALGSDSNMGNLLADSFILLCGLDGTLDDEEYKLYSYLMNKIGHEIKDRDYCESYMSLLQNEDIMDTVANAVKAIGGLADGFVETYLYLAACVFMSNGELDDKELAFLNSLESEDTASTTTSDSSSGNLESSNSFAGSVENKALPVSLERMGANLTSDENYSYLSVGVEIKNPNKSKCAKNVQVKIIVKDANNRILETHTDTISYIDSNKLFCYGAEFSIDRGQPANYNVQINCDEYVDSPEDSTFANGITVSHFNIEKSRWGDSRVFSGNVTNNYSKKLGVELYFIFYDGENHIVGGCNTSLWNLYGKSEDGFEIRLDAYSNKSSKVKACASFNFLDLLD